MIENTKLGDLIDKIQLCFDPNENVSQMTDDNLLIEKYRTFENMVNNFEGIRDENQDINCEKSAWIIRMEMNSEEMLEKNITMDIYITH